LFRFNPAEYKQYKKEALAYVTDCLQVYNQHYRIKFGRLSIRNPRTRWGSCSTANNLSFNYKIVLLPARLAEYIVVHELCHCVHHNHSKDFWALVAQTIPDYRARRRALKAV
jgi:predicted metal-dependent hydrolase